MKKEYKKIYNDLIHHFDISNNIQNPNIDFSNITTIKSEFEKTLHSIEQDFVILHDKFYNKIGNIIKDFSLTELDKMFSFNFDMPLLTQDKNYFIKFRQFKFRFTIIINANIK